jgi:putative addiction module component (TIGR02574 family)
LLLSRPERFGRRDEFFEGRLRRPHLASQQKRIPLGLPRSAVAPLAQTEQTFSMALPHLAIDQLTADERIALIGQLWHSLDPAAAAPISPALAADLAQREAEADANPDAGESWDDIERKLRAKLK